MREIEMAHFLWSRGRGDFYSESWLTDMEDLAALAADLLNAGWRRRSSSHYCYFALEDSHLDTDGWKIHVSSQVRDAPSVIAHVADAVSASGTPFKILKSSQLLRAYNGRFMTKSAAGKFITIYPSSTELAREIVADLEGRLSSNRAVQVLTDDQRSDPPVSFRYGAFIERWRVGEVEAQPVTSDPSGNERHDTRQTYYEQLGNVEPLFTERNDRTDPLDEVPTYTDILKGRWAAIDVISSTNLGAIYRGQDLATGHAVVIKERRGYVDEVTPQELLQQANNIREVANRLEGTANISRILDTFSEWQNVYTVSEYRDGIHLGHFANLEHPGVRNRRDPQLWLRYQLRVLEIGRKLCDLLSAFHSSGMILNDVSVTNFIIELADERISFVDLEDILVVDHDTAATNAINTPGFFPEGGVPSPQTDLYGLARVLHYLLIPIPNALVFRSEETGDLESLLLELIRPHQELSEWLLVLLRDGWQTASLRTVRTDLDRIVALLSDARQQPYCPRENLISYLDRPTCSTESDRCISDATSRTFTGIMELSKQLISSIEHYMGSGHFDHKRILQPAVPGQSVGNLANGVSGIALALHESDCGNTLAAQLVDSCRNVKHMLPGLLNGAAGLALSAARVGLPDVAENHAYYATSFAEMDDSALTLGSGRAGVVLALTAVSDATGNSSWLDEADRLASHIAEQIQSWPEPSSQSVFGGMSNGFLEGPIGIAFALHTLNLRTGRTRYDSTIRRLMRIAVSRVAYTPSGGLSAPTDRNSQVLSHYFGDGSSGLLYALRCTRLENSVSPDTLSRLAEDCTRPFTSFGGLVSGQVGLAMPFTVESDDATLGADFARVERVFESLPVFIRRSKDGQTLFLGPVNLKASLDLANGAAGALLVANRLIARFGPTHNHQIRSEEKA